MPVFTRPLIRTRRIEAFGVRLVRAPLSLRCANEDDAARIVVRLIGDADRETFVVLFLTASMRVRASHVAATGSLSSLALTAREVFRAAILANAHSVIVGHNHPSGDASPSPEDDAFTLTIVEAGHVVGVPVLDHIIVAPERTGGYSYKAMGRMPIAGQE